MWAGGAGRERQREKGHNSSTVILLSYIIANFLYFKVNIYIYIYICKFIIVLQH